MYRILIILFISVFLSSCSFSLKRYTYPDVNTLISNTSKLKTKPSLKLHHINGDVIVFGKYWDIDSTYLSVNGTGIQFDYNRNYIQQGLISVPLDSISIYETNKQGDSEAVIPLVSIIIISLVDAIAALSIFLASLPK